MNKKYIFLLIIFSALITLPSFSQSINYNINDVITSMIRKSREIKTIRYHAVMNERIKDKMILKDSYFKINSEPLKIYVQQSFVGIKIEGLYVEGWNNNKLLISTIGFPWIEVSLDPMGSKVRDNHHHTIFEAGYEYFINVIDEIIKKHGDYINYTNYGFANVHNKKCYKIGLNVINYKIINYTVKNNENLTSIAKKMLINDYKILELNPSISDYYTVKPGQIIKIPNIYAQKMTLFIDTETFLPVQIDIYDEIGLYASYKYLNVIVNQPFDPKEFTVEYKDYHFYR